MTNKDKIWDAHEILEWLMSPEEGVPPEDSAYSAAERAAARTVLDRFVKKHNIKFEEIARAAEVLELLGEEF